MEENHLNPEPGVAIPSREWVCANFRGYLLGELDDDQAEGLEAGLFIYPDMTDQLESAEEELISDYLNRTLSPDRVQQVESRYLPANRHKLLVAGAVQRDRRRRVTPAAAPVPITRKRFSGRQVGLGISLAACALLALYLGVENRRLQKDGEALNQNIRALRSSIQQLDARNRELSARANQGVIDPGPRPGPPPISQTPKQAGTSQATPLDALRIDGNRAARGPLLLTLRAEKTVRWSLPDSEVGVVHEYELTLQTSTGDTRTFTRSTEPGNVVTIPIPEEWRKALPWVLSAKRVDSGVTILPRVKVTSSEAAR
jgi:hypothetical protein